MFLGIFRIKEKNKENNTLTAIDNLNLLYHFIKIILLHPKLKF